VSRRAEAAAFRSFKVSRPEPGSVTIAWNSSVQEMPTSRVFAPLARAWIGGTLPPWRNDQDNECSKWLRRTAGSGLSAIERIASPSAANAAVSQPSCAAMPSGVGTGQRVYQSAFGVSSFISGSRVQAMK